MILITGDKGIVGQILVDELPYLKKKAWSSFDIKSDIYEDLLDSMIMGKIMKERRVKTVIHLAAVTDLTASLKTPAVYSAINYLGTRRVVVAMRWAGVKRIVYASTNSSTFSDNPYSNSKKRAEDYLLAQEDLEVSVIRLDSVINTHSKDYRVRRGSMLDNLLRAHHGKIKKVSIFGNYFRKYMLPKDVVDIFQEAMTGEGGIYECKNPIVMRNRDYADYFVEVFGKTKIGYTEPREFEAELDIEPRLSRTNEFIDALKLIATKKIIF
ncbi:MAG: NAD(P)-dependent oxidoreductase [Acinetobacter sp.]